jgi:uncharacterized protein YecE (DUF72 family)
MICLKQSNKTVTAQRNRVREIKTKQMKEEIRKQIHVGTSGWNYRHWKGVLYPENMKTSEWLPFYARRFATVEINNTFYRMPEKETLETWRDSVPPEFVFSLKASRYITHMKKLKDSLDPVERLMESIRLFGKKLGPVLFQLPPKWKCNPDRLDSFLSVLPSGPRYTLEFRHETWFNPEVYHILEHHNAAFCLYHLDKRMSPKKVTADFVYIRLHGPEGPYKGAYDNRALAGWTGAMTAWAGQGREIFCYFDNDQHGYAVKNALALKQMIET